MVTNSNFRAVLLLRHWALAGHLWGRGCVRSWAMLALRDPTPTPWAPCPKDSGLCRGIRAQGRGARGDPWAVATPSLQLLQISGVMPEHWQCSRAVALGGGDSHGTSEGTKNCAKGSRGQGSALGAAAQRGASFLCVHGHVSPEGDREGQASPGLLSLAVNASPGRCPH